MAENASLDAFLPSAEPTPVRTTYEWSSDTLPCERCGTATDRRWRDDGAMVCRDCKDWSRSP